MDTSLLVKELLRLNVEYRHLSKDRLTLGMTCFEEIGIELSESEGEWFFFDGKTVLIEEDLRAPSACVGRHMLGDNGNYDVYPITTIYAEPDQDIQM